MAKSTPHRYLDKLALNDVVIWVQLESALLEKSETFTPSYLPCAPAKINTQSAVNATRKPTKQLTA